MSFEFLDKCSPNKKKFDPSLEGPRNGVSLHVPQNRAPTAKDAHFQILTLAYPSGSPVKEPSLWVPLIALPQREMLYSRTLLHFLLKSPVYEPSSRFPTGAPMDRNVLFRDFLYISFRVPSKGDLQVPLTGLAQTDAVFPEPSFNYRNSSW